MPLTPCLRCGALGSGSYCRDHDPRRDHGWRGSGGAQAKFRRRTLARAGGRCAGCGARDVALEAHHPLGQAGGHDQVGVALCEACHRGVHARRSA